MIAPPSGVRVWLATGATDMRRGMNGLALQVQEALHRDPHICVGRDLYVFRGRRGDLLKDPFGTDGLGMSLYAQAVGARQVHLAVAGRWRRCDNSSAALLHGKRCFAALLQ